MGILNLNEDSFFAASRTKANEVAARAARLFEEGADVIDLGACSTRPGSTQPDVEEEWKRLEPALKEISSGPHPLPRCGGAQAPRPTILPPKPATAVNVPKSVTSTAKMTQNAVDGRFFCTSTALSRHARL